MVHLCTPSQFIQLPHTQVHLIQIVIATCLLDGFSNLLYEQRTVLVLDIVVVEQKLGGSLEKSVVDL